MEYHGAMHDQQDRQTDYRVAFVPGEALPPNQPWVFIEYDGEVWLAIRQDAVTPETLEETWAAFRDMAS